MISDSLSVTTWPHSKWLTRNWVVLQQFDSSCSFWREQFVKTLVVPCRWSVPLCKNRRIPAKRNRTKPRNQVGLVLLFILVVVVVVGKGGGCLDYDRCQILAIFLLCFCCQPIRNYARKLLSSNIDIAANHPDTLIESCYHRAYVPADQSETVFENCCYRTWGLVENRVINANC